MLAEPPRTAYDLHFKILGFPVRVTPFFWLAAVVLGYSMSVTFDRVMGASSPGLFALLLLWIAAVFLSILIHELGHALMMRSYGERAYIVLYHFGGLAVPDMYGNIHWTGRRNPYNQIAISLAGPGAQFLLAAIILLAVRLSGYEFLFGLGWIDYLWPPTEGEPLPSMLLNVVLFFLVQPSIYWAALNLLPIFPLDGGQVSRELFTMFRGASGFKDSLVLSLVVAAAVAFHFLSTGDTFGAMLFISLGVSSFQLLQALKFGGGW